MATDQTGQNADPTAGFKALLEKHQNDAAALARDLYSENYRLRQKNASLKAAASKAPAEGQVLLSKDEAAAWDAYKKLGVPTELSKLLDTAKGAAAELTELKREKVFGEAAAAHGYKPAVLKRLAKDLDLDLVEAKGEDGTSKKTARVKGADGQYIGLADYAAREWVDLMPALVADGQGSGSTGGKGQSQRSGGAPFIVQNPGGGKAPETDLTARFIEAQGWGPKGADAGGQNGKK